ncbi:MAG: hypothetical protein U1E27_14365, partial [Kiritimatiellia bacterium]|nr:hypothetical protein [Kiritimatiellia bacterium]
RGGIRLQSLIRGERDLGLQSLWHRTKGAIHLIGVNSTLLTLPLFLPEADPAEIPAWEERRVRHREEIQNIFRGIPDSDRILLFCHDPGALGELAQLPEVQARLGQIVQTVLGHLHAPPLLKAAQWMARLPDWSPRYPVARIIAQSIRSAKTWTAFRPVVCPATFGTGHLLSGGMLFLDVDDHRFHLEYRRFPRG